DGSDTQPFSPTLKGRVGKRLVAVALSKASMDVVGVADYDCATCEWTVLQQPVENVTTLPNITDQAIVVGECMYACVSRQLLSVPLGNNSTTSSPTPTNLHPLSLSGQPQYDRDSQYIVLPTAAGDRRQRVTNPLPLLGYGPMVPTVGGRTVVGQCVGGACVDGVVCGSDVCFSVRRGVWCPMAAKGGGTHSVNDAVDTAVSAHSTGSDEGREVSGALTSST
ncbi:hypothetical protein KIPB_016187, partial [Kipferlia bialata]